MYSLDCKLSNITYITTLYWIIAPTVVRYNNNNNNNNDDDDDDNISGVPIIRAYTI